MHELAEVRRLRDDIPAGALDRARARLAAEIAAAPGPGDPVRRRSGRGRMRLLAAVSTATAAVAALVAALVAAPGHGSPPTGAQLVAYATRAAAAEPAFRPRPHQWIYSDVLQAASSAGGGGYLFGPPDRRLEEKSWIRADHLKFAYLKDGKLVISSPNVPRPVRGSHARDAFSLLGWPTTSYSYLDSLPASPARLAAVIRANLQAQDLPPGILTGNAGVDVFNAIQALAENEVLPPRLLASLYGVLARDPAVRFDPLAISLAGRTGVGFSTVQDGYLKTEIVISPKTYAYMGYKVVAVRPHTEAATDGTRHIRAGQVLGWEALVASGIVQRPGQIP